MKVPFNEYWSFLDYFCNLKTPNGFEKLEIYFKQKKLLSIFEDQIKFAQKVMKEQSMSKEKQLREKLNHFVSLSYDLYFEKLALRDNQLSHRYEHIVKLRFDLNKKFDMLQAIIDKCENDNPEAMCLTPTDHEIYNSLVQYMACVIDVSKLDKSSKCYFNLYKTAKQILSLLNCEKPFDNFYLSPIFKRISSRKSNASADFGVCLFQKPTK